MYIIRMNNDKSLSKTVTKTLYQGENLVDKFQFLIPQEYNNLKLSEFNATLKYIDQRYIARSENLLLSKDLYKGMLCFYLPIDSKLTEFSGNIIIHLVFHKDKYILHSGETTITINAVNPCYQHIDRSSENITEEGVPIVNFGDLSKTEIGTDNNDYLIVEF